MFYKIQKRIIARVVLVLLLGWCHTSAADEEPQNILVLNSYHQGYQWTDDMVQGIRRLLTVQLPDAEIYYEYLDTKRHFGDTFFAETFDLFKVKYDSVGFAGVIATDDAAVRFLERYYAELFAGIPVVFCGVGSFDGSRFGDNQPYITGLTTSFNHIAKTIELAISLHEELYRILVLFDKTSSEEYLERIRGIGRMYPNITFEFLNGSDMTTEAFMDTLSAQPDDAVALFITWQYDQSGRYLTVEESTKLISEHASIPVYGLGYHRLNYGIIGGMLNSGAIQGAAAANILVDIINGAIPADIPVSALELHDYYFNYTQLNRWHIDENSLPEQSHVINRPFSFYREYFRLVWSAIVVFVSLVALIGILMFEIRLRRRIEKRAVEQKNILINVLTLIPHMVYWKNTRLEHTGCNQRYADAVGFALPEDVIGLTDRNLTWKRSLVSRLQKTEEHVLATGIPIHDREETELTLNGVLATLQHSIIPMRDSSGTITGILGIFSDVTERKRLEAQFNQAQKMETVGRLAGGIAHDFNNLLTVIIGNAELVLMELPESETLHREVNEIRNTANRAATLTRQLLGFSRRQMIKLETVDITDMIIALEKMLRRLIGEDIELVIIHDENIWPVCVDPGQIEQVLTNLLVNARDAMPRGGTITIRTENAHVDNAQADTHEQLPPGDYLVVMVTDTGEGMDAETLTKAFEPFFTTKEKGKGTGLGLSTCYGIVKQNDGHIEIDSIPYKGTTITMYLPRSHEPITERLQVPLKRTITGGSETVLLVEDEPALNTMIKHILQEKGYLVLTALNGQEALSVLERHRGDTIHLLITDVIMPKIGGHELVERMHAFGAQMKVLFMSGYTDNTIISEDMDESLADFIQKPFAPVDFLLTVRQLLDRQVHGK